MGLFRLSDGPGGRRAGKARFAMTENIWNFHMFSGVGIRADAAPKSREQEFPVSKLEFLFASSRAARADLLWVVVALPPLAGPMGS